MSADPAASDRPAGWPPGIGRRIHASLPSTLSEAARIAPGLTAPCWILALDQTAGRGRRGRPWVMPRGNFAGTLVMRPREPAAQMALRSFVAALALYDALGEATEQWSGLALKWPNDVLLNGGKVAGILLEAAGPGQGPAHLAIGIGVNLAGVPEAAEIEPGALRPVSLRGETGTEIAPEAFLTLLARAYAHWEGLFAAQGFAPVRDAWLARAARLGEPIRARTGTEERHGIFETVDESGALVLGTPAGPRAIPAAEVFF